MKILKTMAVIAGLLCAFSLEAQFPKGSNLLGTDIGFNIDLKDKNDPDDYKAPYTNDSWDKNFGFNFSPEFIELGVLLLLRGTNTGE